MIHVANSGRDKIFNTGKVLSKQDIALRMKTFSLFYMDRCFRLLPFTHRDSFNPSRASAFTTDTSSNLLHRLGFI